MWNNGHDAYLESKVLSADPVELVNLLYQASIQAVRDARHFLAQGEIADRSRAINKACEILIELNSSLDRERGGEIVERLAPLYDYMLGRLLEANLQQSDAPLAEVQSLLATLSEAWAGVRPQAAPPAAVAANPWSQEAPQATPWSQAPDSVPPQAVPAAPVAANPWSQESGQSAYLSQAWEGAPPEAAPEAPAGGLWSQEAGPEAYASASHGWSL